MAYFDHYLADGERIVYRTKEHPATFSLFSFWLIIISFAGFLGGLEDLSEICLGLAAVFAIYMFLLRLLSDFVVTNRRVVGRNLIASPTEVPLIEIRDVEFKSGILSSLFDYGTVVITDSQGAKHKFPGVPGEFYRQVQARDARVRRILR